MTATRSGTLIFLSFVFAFCNASKSQSLDDSLIGVWQDSKVVASGWSNTFLFFKSGRFKFFYNQMDCAKREVSYSGKWRAAGDELILTISEKTVIEGGELEPSSGSCASDSMIVGGTEATMKLRYLEKVLYSISSIYSDIEDDMQRQKVYIDAMPYWKFADNPEELINQFEFVK